MHVGNNTFFGVITEPLLVIRGEETKLTKGQHTREVVYSEMLRQVVRDYNGIGDYRKLTAAEIRFFYDGLRAELKEATKPGK